MQLFFVEIITLLVVVMNRYYHQFLDNSIDTPSPQRKVAEAEMFAFLALTLQMRHTVQGRLENYQTKMEQLSCPFYRQIMVMWSIMTYYVFFISQKIMGMELTGQMTDYGKYETYLKF